MPITAQIARFCWNLARRCNIGTRKRRTVKIHFRSNPIWRTAPTQIAPKLEF